MWHVLGVDCRAPGLRHQLSYSLMGLSMLSEGVTVWLSPLSGYLVMPWVCFILNQIVFGSVRPGVVVNLTGILDIAVRSF